MEFICYTDWKQLPLSANALFTHSSQRSIFFSRPWFENLTDTELPQDQTLLLACVVEEDEILALLPLMTADYKHVFGLTHLYSSLFSLLWTANNGKEKYDQNAVTRCLAQGLDKLPIKSLRLDPVAEDDQGLQLLQKAMMTLGYQYHQHFRFYNWIHRLQGQSFENYMATRPSRVRNTIKRKRRKMAREHGFEIRLYTDQSVHQALADYTTVYRASWKAFEQFDGFIEGLAKRLSEVGWLRLAILYTKNKPVAAQFWFVTGRKASIFKLVYDQDWKQYSPGSILISYLMEHVIEKDQVEEIDFLTGNDAYKHDWMSERRKRWTVSLYKQDSDKPNKPGKMIDHILNPLRKLRSSN